MMIMRPDWPVSNRVKSYVTTRHGGVSVFPFDNFNLASHVGDNTLAVETNRLLLTEILHLPSEPVWLTQVHGCDIYHPDEDYVDNTVDNTLTEELAPIADASITYCEDRVLVVMTADCLPILITNRAESFVMAVHAGWRGLADGIIHDAIAHTSVDPAELLVWIGPGIGASAFEVGDDVYQAFLAQHPDNVEYFKTLDRGSSGEEKYLGDMVGIAKRQLASLGIGWIGGGNWCTYTDHEHFFSYRRDGQTGRMASLIWLSHNAS